MTDREQLLDELARVFAHAAVDALLASAAEDDSLDAGSAEPQYQAHAAAGAQH